MTESDAANGRLSVVPPHTSPDLTQTSAASGPVEARSLSALTAIASNPPAYPRNPTHGKHDPLALYIVRVPGSRDVFLSPLKPPTKSSVSAEAINSSLYYLHVATPEDEALLRELEIEREGEMRERRESGKDNEANPGFIRLNNVRRKPVGGSLQGSGRSLAADSTTLSVTPGRPISVHRDPLVQPVDQTQVEPHGSAALSATDDLIAPPLPQRRPLPPASSVEPLSEGQSHTHSAGKSNRRGSLSGYFSGRGLDFKESWKDNWRERYESLTANRQNLESRPTSFTHNRPVDSPASPMQPPSRKPHENPPTENSGFHITLIRRDVTHGIQWNVATMSTPRVDGSSIDIEISTPGYGRFAAQDDSDGLNTLSLSGLKLQPQLCPPGGHQSGAKKFRRQLHVSKLYHEDARESAGSDFRPPTAEGSPGFPRLKSGYYTFTSPWNGICTFAMSVNGRSLKCKHMIPSPTSSSTFNSESQPSSSAAVVVAELRFNTPFQAGNLSRQPSASHPSPFALSQTHSSHLPARADQPYPLQPYPLQPSPERRASGAGSKRNTVTQLLNPNIYTRRRSHLPHPRTNSTVKGHSYSQSMPSVSSTSSAEPTLDSDDGSGKQADIVEERMDLSLAREPAGGGMRGKSAKLGKLIVEDEGIKMLDLVVAACMTVWWRGYYY